MKKEVFSLFLLIHVLCDFYFQSSKTAERKRTSFKWVLYHILIYTGIATVLFIIFLPGLKLKYIVLFSVSHGIVDIVKYHICKYFFGQSWDVKKEPRIFLADQTTHILLISIIVYILPNLSWASLPRSEIMSIVHSFDLSGKTILSWGIKILLVHKPLNIIISAVLAPYRPQQKDDKVNDKNMGRLIGTLERIIMMIFISIGQYSAVGLVLTAKSIARYDRISKQQDFAEYYLLGTLLSTIGAIGISLLF